MQTVIWRGRERMVAAFAALFFTITFLCLPWMLPRPNYDIDHYYRLWLMHILRYGRLASLEGSFANYSPPYIYLLSAVSLLHRWITNPVVLIKIINLPFMILLGFATRAIGLHLGCNRRLALAAGLLVALDPEVVVNGLLWGQCDVIYTMLLLTSIFSLLCRRPVLGALLFGVALAFKLQTIFIAPGLFALVLAGEISPLVFGWSAIAYCVMLLPAYFAGRPIHELVNVYGAQAETYTSLSMGAANLWTVVQHFVRNNASVVTLATRAGILLTALAALALCFYYVRNKKLHTAVGRMSIVTLALLSVPFLLPRMHDRYFFAGDTFLLVVAMGRPSLIPAAVLAQVGSLITYVPFLLSDTQYVLMNGNLLVPAVFCMTAAMILLLRDIRKQAHQEADLA